jgi:outer membrane protein OmpA-like peptidoglycan-associated protein
MRAKSVVEYLVSNGIPGIRLQSKGFGETSPVAPNDTDGGRKLNRRTTVKIDKY